MTVRLPDYVEQFIELVRLDLAGFSARLELEKEYEAGRSYRARTGFGTTDLVLQQIQRPSGPVDYRARCSTVLPDPYREVFRHIFPAHNRFATLGALISGNAGPEVLTQCIIHEDAIVTEARTLATAMVHAASSLVGSLRNTILEEDPIRFAVQLAAGETEREGPKGSAWTELDFQRLAHLGIRQLDERHWFVPIVECSSALSLEAMDESPYWGGGLHSVLRMPADEISANGRAVSPHDLNLTDWCVGEAPTFGAWYDDADRYEFVSFAPNFLRDLPDFTEHFVKWGIIRAHTIKQRFQIMLDTAPRLQ